MHDRSQMLTTPTMQPREELFLSIAGKNSQNLQLAMPSYAPLLHNGGATPIVSYLYISCADCLSSLWHIERVATFKYELFECFHGLIKSTTFVMVCHRK